MKILHSKVGDIDYRSIEFVLLSVLTMIRPLISKLQKSVRMIFCCLTCSHVFASPPHCPNQLVGQLGAPLSKDTKKLVTQQRKIALGGGN